MCPELSGGTGADPGGVGVKVLVAGRAVGEVLRLDQPLSFWGGVDPSTGLIVDERHPQHGLVVSGRILSMPHGRGSSSSSAVLAETLRLGTGPAAIVLDEMDSILVVGALVAGELYGVECPIVMSDAEIQTGEVWTLNGESLTRSDA